MQGILCLNLAYVVINKYLEYYNIYNGGKQICFCQAAWCQVTLACGFEYYSYALCINYSNGNHQCYGYPRSVSAQHNYEKRRNAYAGPRKQNAVEQPRCFLQACNICGGKACGNVVHAYYGKRNCQWHNYECIYKHRNVFLRIACG